MPGSDRLRAILLGDPTTAAGGVTATQISAPINCAGYTYLTAFYTSTGTTSGGTIILEEADYADEPLHESPFTGTWSQIESRAASSFTGGVTLAYHVPPGAFAWVRARISGAITGGGSIVVTLRGHE